MTIASVEIVTVVQAELAQLNQGMLQLRLQREEAAARLKQIEDAIQQQAGAITAIQRLVDTLTAPGETT